MRRKLFDSENHAYFVTFSCYRRRKILDHDRAKQIVIHYLVAQLNNQSGTCTGFVIMPDHVHAIIHFQKAGLLSIFMNQWKRRSSMQLKKFFRTHLAHCVLPVSLRGFSTQLCYHRLSQKIRRITDDTGNFFSGAALPKRSQGIL
jgi:putative transposase